MDPSSKQPSGTPGYYDEEYAVVSSEHVVVVDTSTDDAYDFSPVEVLSDGSEKSIIGLEDEYMEFRRFICMYVDGGAQWVSLFGEMGEFICTYPYRGK